MKTAVIFTLGVLFGIYIGTKNNLHNVPQFIDTQWSHAMEYVKGLR